MVRGSAMSGMKTQTGTEAGCSTWGSDPHAAWSSNISSSDLFDMRAEKLRRHKRKALPCSTIKRKTARERGVFCSQIVSHTCTWYGCKNQKYSNPFGR